MGYDYWSYDSTYRGIDIEQFTSSQDYVTTYRAYTDKWVMSTSRAAVKSAIDAYLDVIEPHWEYHSLYRNIDIWIWMPDATSYAAYFDGEWHYAAVLSTLKFRIDEYLGPLLLSVTLNGIVTPAKAGFLVYLEWPTPPYGWSSVDSQMTDVNGKVVMMGSAPAWPETPQTYRMNILSGQVVDGVEYGGYISEEVQVWGDSEVDLYLYPEPADIPTSLSITAPDKVEKGEPFTAYGNLYETETGTPIQGMRIDISYNGKILGYVFTGIEGEYYINISINEGGVWTLKAEFPGTETLRASNAYIPNR